MSGKLQMPCSFPLFYYLPCSFQSYTNQNMETGITKLQEKVKAYKEVLQNTKNYRKQWQSKTKGFIIQQLLGVIEQTGLRAKVTEKANIENLESVVLDLGRSSSGIGESFENTDFKNFMVKNNGALIYQQLFNGKIMVMLVSPHIEGYGEPKSPEGREILRPEEVTEESIQNNIESLLDVLIQWEDYDDDLSKVKNAFQPIGFKHGPIPENGDETEIDQQDN